MKKVSIILFMLLLGVTFNGFSQAPAPADFFVGTWKSTFQGGPQGEMNAQIDIVRKDGKLTIHLSSANLINSRVQEERATELLILSDHAINPGLATQQITGRDLPITLTKVDDNTLEAGMSGMPLSFKRVK